MLSLTFIEQPRERERQGKYFLCLSLGLRLENKRRRRKMDWREWDPVHSGHWRRKLKTDDLGRKRAEGAMPRK